MQILLGLDTALTQIIYLLPHTIAGDIFFQFFSFIGSFGIVWIILFIIVAVIGEKKHRHFVIPFTLALIISIILTSTVFKPIFERPRPLHGVVELEKPSIINYPVDYSFPSGHATVAFAGAVILTSFDTKRKRYYYTIAVLIAFSRVYLGFHYLGDIIAGGLLGWGIGVVLLNKKLRWGD